jgi:hypothetical protein
VENSEQSVEIVQDPHVGNRFGFQHDRASIPKHRIVFCICATLACVVIVMLFQGPAQPNVDDIKEIRAPDPGQLTDQTDKIHFDNYSAESESASLKEKAQGRRVTISKLPGLQKFERSRGKAIPPGMTLKAILVNGASNGTVKVEVTESLLLQGETLVPEGAVLIGVGQSTEDRLFIRFNTLVFKDGTTENIQAQAIDTDDRIAGLKGSRIGRYAIKYGAAVGLNFAGGLAQGLQEKEVINQQAVTKTDTKNALLNGASRATLEMANETMTNLRNQTPVIEVKAGKEVIVMFEGT